jgi:hypothetical protein
VNRSLGAPQSARPSQRSASLSKRASAVGGDSPRCLRIGVTLKVGLCAIGLVQASSASAASFLETFGLSVAGGTVLGASTLPFYEQPGDHSANLAWGAAIGAAVGLGVWWATRRGAAASDWESRRNLDAGSLWGRSGRQDLLFRKPQLPATVLAGSVPSLSLLAARSP